LILLPQIEAQLQDFEPVALARLYSSHARRAADIVARAYGFHYGDDLEALLPAAIMKVYWGYALANFRGEASEALSEALNAHGLLAFFEDFDRETFDSLALIGVCAGAGLSTEESLDEFRARDRDYTQAITRLDDLGKKYGFPRLQLLDDRLLSSV
jgi:hypothetical protein